MSPLPALDSDNRTWRRLRDRASICTHGAQDAALERRGGTPTGGRLTLGQLLEGVWEGLSAGGEAACPICHGEMWASADGAARCEGCGTSLS